MKKKFHLFSFILIVFVSCNENYSISDFHEKLLKIGNMPPSLMKESLFK